MVPSQASANIREPDPRFRRRYDWQIVQAFYDAGHSASDCVAHFGFSSKTWHNAIKRGAIRTRPHAIPIEQLLAAPRGRGHLKKRLLREGLLASRCRGTQIPTGCPSGAK
jgi:hypothetical protein